ncbi:MAG TPA: phosphate-starvation-inducible PsiE family protein [Actinomycetota bacterium]|nr:phosphate-starvation-inducible PsiE family protein [Actinomycetota bacterium]
MAEDSKVDRDEMKFRERSSMVMRGSEDVLYIGVSVVLAAAGLILFGNGLYAFATALGEGELSSTVLELLDAMLLVFIVTELIHTISSVIRERVLLTEPFLIVGIVAAIRRLVLISAAAKDLLGKPDFADAMLEIGVLTAAIVLLSLSIFLLRHTTRSEPRPDYEPKPEE